MHQHTCLAILISVFFSCATPKASNPRERRSSNHPRAEVQDPTSETESPANDNVHDLQVALGNRTTQGVTDSVSPEGLALANLAKSKGKHINKPSGDTVHQPSHTFSIAVSKSCLEKRKTNLNIFNNGSSDFIGGTWNNAAKQNLAGEQLLAYDKAEFFRDSIDWDIQLSTNELCEGEMTLNGTLLRKYHNWIGGSPNGIYFSNGKISHDQLDAIFIDMRIDASRSKILTAAELETSYRALVRSELGEDFSAREIDDGSFAIEITLQEKDLSSSQKNLKASYLVTLDLEKYSGKWLRVMIPASQMNYYSEENHIRTPLQRKTLSSKNLTYTGGTIVAKTSTAKSLRNYFVKKAKINNNYANDEVFHSLVKTTHQKIKEEYLELREIGVIYR